MIEFATMFLMVVIVAGAVGIKYGRRDEPKSLRLSCDLDAASDRLECVSEAVSTAIHGRREARDRQFTLVESPAFADSPNHRTVMSLELGNPDGTVAFDAPAPHRRRA